MIETVLSEYAALPYSYAPIQSEVIFDRTRDRFSAIGIFLRVDQKLVA